MFRLVVMNAEGMSSSCATIRQIPKVGDNGREKIQTDENIFRIVSAGPGDSLLLQRRLLIRVGCKSEQQTEGYDG